MDRTIATLGTGTSFVGEYAPGPLPLLRAPDPREAKLPAWARTLLEDTRRDAARALDLAEHAQHHARRALLETGPTRCDTLLDPYGEAPIGLGDSPTVHFRTGHETYFDVHVNVDVLDITASSSLVIEPAVSNHIRLYVRRR